VSKIEALFGVLRQSGSAARHPGDEVGGEDPKAAKILQDAGLQPAPQRAALASPTR
jgi:hypothetical protein